jgi:ABC-2 type transport system ATP-binding protein
MDEAEHCHRLAFIQRGKIIAQGSPEGIKRDVMKGRVIEIAPKDPINTMQYLRQLKEENKLEIENVELYGSLVHVISENTETQLKIIEKELKKAKIEPGQISIIDPSLEDVFIAAMK